MSKTQQRQVFLCSDVLLYGARNPSPAQRAQIILKGKIWLHDGARVERHSLRQRRHLRHRRREALELLLERRVGRVCATEQA